MIRAKKRTKSKNPFSISRLFCIFQLCISFSFILWWIGEPFTLPIFQWRSSVLLFQNVMGKGDLVEKWATTFEDKEQLQKNAVAFAALPDEERKVINHNYQRLLTLPFPTLLQKLRWVLTRQQALKVLWVLGGAILAFWLLKEKEGTKEAIYLLPITALASYFFSPAVSPTITTVATELTATLISARDLNPFNLSSSGGLPLWTVFWSLALCFLAVRKNKQIGLS